MNSKTTDPVQRERLMSVRFMLMGIDSLITLSAISADQADHREIGENIRKAQMLLDESVNDLVELLAVK